MPKRILQGTVVSKTEKTIVVSVERMFNHPLYKKRVSSSKKYKAHDEAQTTNVGDTVKIVESKPISKTKKWRVLAS